MNQFSSMKISQLNKIFFYILLLQFCYLSNSQAPYTLPEHYFINCGSSSTLPFNGRNFTGDVNSSNLRLPSGSTTVRDASPSGPELYQSARVFRKRSAYELEIVRNGTYVVRFHFSAFPGVENLARAHFNVEVLGFTVLSNFSVSSNSPRVEEFLVTVPQGKLAITTFVPSREKDSFAFVNAIELFLAPPDFIRDNAPDVARDGTSRGNYYGLLSSALHVIHRINVGGQNVTPDIDTLLRNWVPDDAYILSDLTARNSDPYNNKPKYQPGGATEFDAPDPVYQTAKEMNITDNSNNALNQFKISWFFGVNKGAIHLVRVHFCDIVSRTTNQDLKFNLFIYGGTPQVIYPWDRLPQPAAPFYNDYVVESSDSGFMNISIGALRDSVVQMAFLNGVEIMELIHGVSSAQGGEKSTKGHLLVIIGSSIGGLIFVLVILSMFCFVLRRRKWKPVEDFDWPLAILNGGKSYDSRTTRTSNRTAGSSTPAHLNLGLKIQFSEIMYATKNFNSKLIIGEGGFGKVYKGMLRNGTKVAVKRSEAGHGQGLPEFHTEIMVLSKIRHHHLVSLVGYCDERDEMILVYEFMEKGTLREHLYVEPGKSGPSSQLSWDQRLRICIGAAKGIHYLHTGSNGAIIHRDIKSTNILLDEHYIAKVADFGLSRSGPLDQTHVSTDVKGSFGYLDPEYFRFLQLTQKSDVYSFGVVLLEVLCARPALDNSLPREQINLAEWGSSWQQKGELGKIVDPFLVGKINPDSLRKFGETVENCLQDCGADRPNMVDVLWDLEYCLQLQHRGFVGDRYEDSTTIVSCLDLNMSAVQRLPSRSLGSVDEVPRAESYSFPGASKDTSSQVFSQLNMNTDGAR